MSAVTASLCSTLMFVLFVSADQKNITAESGQDVTLTCRAPNNNIIVVKWSRADLGDKYVLLYRDEQVDPDNQHPSFKNRVDLQDRQMKDGDVSLILKNVTINDTGTYKCGVYMEETKPRWLISMIHLHVVPPGEHTTTPPPTSTSPPGSTSITLPPSLSSPVLSVLSCVGSVCVVVLLVLLVLLVGPCVHRKPEDQEKCGNSLIEDDIYNSVIEDDMHSDIKKSHLQQEPFSRIRDRDPAAVYSTVKWKTVMDK